MSVAGDSSQSDVECDVAGDDSHDSPQPVRAAPRQRGFVGVFLLLASRAGAWSSIHSDPHAFDLASGNSLLFGVGLVRWRFETTADAGSHADQSWYHKASLQTRGEIFGFVVYELVEWAATPRTNVGSTIDPIVLLQHFGQLRIDESWSVEERLASWKANHDLGSIPLPVWLAPGLSMHVASGVGRCLHILALTARCKTNRLLGAAPSPYELGRLRTFFGSSGRRAPHRQPAIVARRRPPTEGWIPAEEVVDWLRTSLDLKQIRSNYQTASKYARIFARTGTETAAAMMARTRSVNHDTIRLARTRLDVTAMLIFRRFFETLPVEDLAIYIWCDSSPQWRGLELFASTFEISMPGFCIRRAFPFITPALGLSSFAKGVALLWQIFLTVGPSFLLMRRFCNAVCGFCTDMGAERLICTSVDMLVEFFYLIRDKNDYSDQGQTFMYPNGLQIYGWRHKWDTVLRRALSQLSWFPKWLDNFKAVMIT
jgi:hypothetical protein